jgi:hypothetical protein
MVTFENIKSIEQEHKINNRENQFTYYNKHLDINSTISLKGRNGKEKFIKGQNQ